MNVHCRFHLLSCIALVIRNCLSLAMHSSGKWTLAGGETCGTFTVVSSLMVLFVCYGSVYDLNSVICLLFNFTYAID